MPTGWRPADVADRYPVEKITDVYHFEKYRTDASPFLIGWSWFQFVMTLLLMLFMLFRFSAIGFPDLFIYGAFILAGVYGYTSLMDRLKSGIWVEVARGIAGLAFIWTNAGWFGIEELFPLANGIVGLYFLATIIGAVYLGRSAVQDSPITASPSQRLSI